MTRPSPLHQSKHRDILAALVLMLLPLVYFLPAVRGQLVLAPDDGLIFNVPLRVAAANTISAGYLPLWNPYIFSGMPLLGAAQAGILFPLNWFYLFFSPSVATNLMMLSTYALAALGAYLYARRSGASIFGAAATSLIWQSSGFLVGQIGHTNIVQTAALLPWLLWAVDGYGATGDRRQGLALAAIVALQAFTGHQQTLAYSLLLAGAYAIVMWRASRVARNWYLWALVLLAAGVVLSAVQILPTYELMRNSVRVSSSFAFFSSFSLPPRFLLTFFAPYLMGGGDGSLFRAPYVSEPFYGEFIGYVGLGTLMLAAFGILVKRDARTNFWTAAVFVALALAIGRYWPFKLYGVIYYLPILNLFRVSARHMMEVDLALAVLAGRGLTAVTAMPDIMKTKKWALRIGVGVLVLTCLVVTIGRPANFRLSRDAPVSLIRAPELFLPIVLAAISAWALWLLARRRSRSKIVFLLAVLVLDLGLWGQSSGWRISSPRSDSDYWQVPDTVKYFRDRERQNQGQYRILTAPHQFDPGVAPVGPSVSRSTDWVLWTQPDIYMMHGIENAAGYDGFGLARYSRLAGNMKVWGELDDPDRTLRGDSRALDILNVRYLLSHGRPDGASSTADATSPQAPGSSVYPTATRELGGAMFAETDLGVPSLGSGKRLEFSLPAVMADRIALLTNLSWSEGVPDGTVIGHVRLRTNEGRIFEFPLSAGADSAEWAYDRPDIRRRIQHSRARVGTSYPVEDAQGKYEAHTYVASFPLPEKETIIGGEITVETSRLFPDLLLSVFRVSLMDSGASKTFPLRRDMMSLGSAPTSTAPQESLKTDSRWRLLTRTSYVDIFENKHALPRAWLVGDTRVLSEQAALDVISSGKLPDGQVWDPLRTALVESALTLSSAGDNAGSRAEITKHEPNRIEARTSSMSPSLLVLSENHYPGWRSYLDGRYVETVRVNYNQRGVLLPAGEHVVEVVYRPKSVLLGLIISLFGAALLVLWWRAKPKDDSLKRRSDDAVAAV